MPPRLWAVVQAQVQSKSDSGPGTQRVLNKNYSPGPPNPPQTPPTSPSLSLVALKKPDPRFLNPGLRLPSGCGTSSQSLSAGPSCQSGYLPPASSQALHEVSIPPTRGPGAWGVLYVHSEPLPPATGPNPCQALCWDSGCMFAAPCPKSRDSCPTPNF